MALSHLESNNNNLSKIFGIASSLRDTHDKHTLTFTGTSLSTARCLRYVRRVIRTFTPQAQKGPGPAAHARARPTSARLPKRTAACVRPRNAHGGSRRAKLTRQKTGGSSVRSGFLSFGKEHKGSTSEATLMVQCTVLRRPAGLRNRAHHARVRVRCSRPR